jgi:putative DNA primase/helicase
MIDGFLDWKAHGLVRPEVVRQATDEYFDDQDVFGQWLDECCDLGAIHAGTNARLFASWRRYAEAAGEDAGSAKSFSQAMRKRGFEAHRTGGGRGFKGVDVIPQKTDADPRYGF